MDSRSRGQKVPRKNLSLRFWPDNIIIWPFRVHLLPHNHKEDSHVIG